MNIYEKMLKATDKIGVVAKNLSVDTGGGRGYKAVSERDIIDAVKPIEIELGIYSFPFSREIVESDMLEKETKSGKRTDFYTKLKTVYRFVNTEKPEEYIDIVSYAVGLDSGDKGDGKAMTYADKYALMKAYKISTGDDPDQKASDPEANYTKQKIDFPDPVAFVNEKNVTALFKSAEAHGVPMDTILSHYNVSNAGELTMEQWMNAMKKLEATK